MLHMLGKRLATLRRNKSLSQYELAEKLGFSRGKLANYEQGSRQPDFETLMLLADFFGVTVDFLLRKNNKQAENEVVSITEIIHFLKKHNIDQPSFLNVENWLAMGSEDIRELESYFEFIASRAMKRSVSKID